MSFKIVHLTGEKNGSRFSKKHMGFPSKNFLVKHPEFTKVEITGYFNEFFFTTKFHVENGICTEISDVETHQRNQF